MDPVFSPHQSTFKIFSLERVSPCSPDWSGTFYVDQAGLELVDIYLALPPECWH